MINASLMSRRLRGKVFSVTRQITDGAFSPDGGNFQPGETTTFLVNGSLQPLGFDEIVSIPEGDRTRLRYRFYSSPGLLNNDTSKLRKGDLVNVDGNMFYVEQIAQWPSYGKAIIAKVNTDAN